MSGLQGEGAYPPHRRRVVGSLLATLLAVAAVALAIVGGGGGSGSSHAVGVPHIVSVSDLTELESALGHPLYWAGERPPNQLELKEEEEGSVYLRYLPPGTEAGDPNQQFLTVGTYPVPSAVAALRRTAARAGVSVERLSGGGVVLRNPGSEGSVYLAYPGTDLEIEVYDPLPGRSLRLIRSGAIEPVGQSQ